MTEQGRQLVDLVTREVLRVLQSQSAATAPTQPARPAETRTEVHPPIGTCTGDYSRFPELRGRLYDQQPVAPAPAPTAANADAPAVFSSNTPAPLSGIITASQLQAALAASPDGSVLLAGDARPTPLANDWIRQHPQRVRRASAWPSAQTAGKSPVAASNVATLEASGGWLWWIDGACPVALKVMQARNRQVRPLAAPRQSHALGQVIRDYAAAVKRGSALGGVLFVPSAARALVLANRCSALRAVVGTCDQTVEQGVRDVGMNVLIIEYPHHGERSMSAMVDRLLAQAPSVTPLVQRELADLQRGAN